MCVCVRACVCVCVCRVGTLGQMQVCLPTKVISSRRLALTLAVALSLFLNICALCLILSCLLPEHAGIRDAKHVYRHVSAFRLSVHTIATYHYYVAS